VSDEKNAEQLSKSEGPHIDMWNIRVDGEKVQVVRAGDFYILAKKLTLVENERNDLLLQIEAIRNNIPDRPGDRGAR
jgi:hypothetical protein